jgi:hypothetical protein
MQKAGAMFHVKHRPGFALLFDWNGVVRRSSREDRRSG